MADRKFQKVEVKQCRILVIEHIPAYISPDAIEQFCSTFEALIDVRRSMELEDSSNKYDLILVFRGYGCGFEALGLTGERNVEIDSSLFKMSIAADKYGDAFCETYSVSVVDTQDLGDDFEDRLATHDSTILRLDKTLFPGIDCKWCLDQKEANEISTPCISCKEPICKECMIRSMETALQDRNNMPLRCCHLVMHPAAFEGVVLDDSIKVYTTRLEEMQTKLPFYCPINTCSQFIPPHRLTSIDGRVHCPTCKDIICFHCRQSADLTHTCSRVPTEKDEILEKFSYKLCPHCGHGQQKLYGCNSVRCPCGAHWCWLCGNPWDFCACFEQPPARVEDEDLHDPDDPETEEDSNDLDEPEAAEVLNENLDSPYARNWENDDLELGGDPDDDDEMSFECHHTFVPLLETMLPRHWSTTSTPSFCHPNSNDPPYESEREVECLTCHEQATITTRAARRWYLHYYGPDQVEKRREFCGKAEKLACWCVKCGTICCRGCMHANGNVDGYEEESEGGRGYEDDGAESVD